MAAVYSHTSHGERLRAEDPTRDEELLARHYQPYAKAMTDLVGDRLAATGSAVILDVHSYASRPLPYELHGSDPRPAVCLGTDSFHTPPALLLAARAAFVQCGDVDVDTPFAGCYVPLRYYRREPAVAAMMVEIRRDTYMHEPGGAPTGGLTTVATALATLVDAASTK
jgi:N-formylglutamate amidohydrolase